MRKVVLSIALALLGHSSTAGVCDYAPPTSFGEDAGAITAIGAGLKAYGFYPFPSATGRLMLGSTAAGSSAARTVGIIANSARIAAVVVPLMSPPVLTIAGAIALGTVACTTDLASIQGVAIGASERVGDRLAWLLD